MVNQDVHSPSLPAADLTRRDCLRLGLWGGLCILTAESLAATVASLWPQVKAGGFGSVVTIGKADNFPVGSVTSFPEARFYLSRVESGFLALSRKCTHLGCVVPWQKDEPSLDKIASEGRFNCPCHGGMFDRYGQVIAGPPPRPMDLYPVKIEDGMILVDTGKIIRRDSFNPSQVLGV
ncbi:MAG TPA: ubiquinol-cytochrome c reductase iron-sulfur subunit [Syntrophales bacterium]|nr:ubiquinol-cytochrome c reductase iron-sulfur subunit [Syntrophales bacterium]